MTEVAGAEPAARLALLQRDVLHGKVAVAIDSFVASLIRERAS
jgi:hypothetical protein